MTVQRIVAGALAVAAALAFPAASRAGEPTAPHQATVTLDVPAAGGASAAASSKLEGGNARVRIRVINRQDDRTATVRLRFRYAIPPETIALDEIIDRISVETSDGEGNRIGRTEIDPHEVNLNPNGPRLAYDLTLYRPEGAYEVELQVFGNYE